MQLTAEFFKKDNISLQEKISLAWRLSLPAILAQLTTILMQYIDAAMVGQLGAQASASIGLVSSTLWLFGGLGMAAQYGYAVQIAHAVGAGDEERSKDLFRQGLLAVTIFGVFLMAVGVLISPHLPHWLGGNEEISREATRYFQVCMWVTPISMLQRYAGAALQSAGNMKTPSLLNSLMCVFDVIFNMVLIFPTGPFTLGPIRFHLYGAGWGVYGAAWGTALSHIVVCVAMMYVACCKERSIKLSKEQKFRLTKPEFKQAVRISVPIGLEQIFVCGAQVASTRIVAPLGTDAIAANSFAVTAESLCYMPGYGLGAAATTLVGQSFGARRRDLARSFSWITTFMGMAIMSIAGVIMYFISPALMGFMTPVRTVSSLAVKVLRIELLAEPLFGASIVASGALRGAGDTLIPSLMNLFSIWGVRITLAAILAGSLGLTGVWIAMCVELCFRGLMMLARMKFGHWMPEST